MTSPSRDGGGDPGIGASSHPASPSSPDELQPVDPGGPEPAGIEESQATLQEALDLGPGSRIGDYEIRSEIGQGAMGVVYEAFQHSLQRRVALKFLKGDFWSDPRKRHRFQAEAETIARLDNPGIVQIHGINEHRGHPFLSLQFVEGRDLSRRMEEISLPAVVRTSGPGMGSAAAPQKQIAQMLSRVSLAIHEAHRCGVLHLDLKPANIIVDDSGQPKITDFGLARRGIERPISTSQAYIEGSPSYIAPELLTGSSRATAQSDIYSIGAVGYELVTGEPPFEAGNPVETLLQVRNGKPTPVRDLEPTVDRDLEAILIRCLARDPEARYRSAHDLAEDLDRFVAGHPVEARPITRWNRFLRWCRRHPGISLLLGGIVLLVTTVGLTTRDLHVAVTDRDHQKAATFVAESKAERLGMEPESRAPLATPTAKTTEQLKQLSTEWIAQSARWTISLPGRARERSQPDAPVTMSPDFGTAFSVDAEGWVQALDITREETRWSWSPPEGERVFDLSTPNDRHLIVTTDQHLILLDSSRNPPEERWRRRDMRLLTPGSGGEWILVTGPGGRVERVECDTGRDLGTLGLQGLAPGEVVASPDPSSRLLAVLAGDVLRIFDQDQNQSIGSWRLPGTFRILQWSGDWIAAGGDEGHVVIHHVPSGTQGLLPAQQAPISRLLFVPGTEYLFITSTDGQTTFWDAATRVRLRISRSSPPLQFHRQGRQFLYATPRSWGLGTLNPSRSRIVLSLVDSGLPPIRSLDFSDDGRWMVVGKQAGVHLVDLTQRCPPTFHRMHGTLFAHLIPETRNLLVQSREGFDWFPVDLGSGRIQPEAVHHHPHSAGLWIEAAKRLPGESVLTFQGLDGVPQILDPKTRLVVGVRPAPMPRWEPRGTAGALRPGGPVVPRISPDHRFGILSDLLKHRLVTWPQGEVIRSDTVQGNLASPTPLATWMADCRQLAWVTDRDTITVIRAQNGATLLELTTPEPSLYTALRFSPDRRWLATGNTRGKVELWDLTRLEGELAAAGYTPTGTDGSATADPLPLDRRPRSRPTLPSRISLSGSITRNPPRDPGAGSDILDLSPFLNSTLEDGFLSPNANRPNLHGLPQGLVRFDDIPFDLRGMVRLRGGRVGLDRPPYPSAITNNIQPRPVQRVHLLSAAHHVPLPLEPGLEIGSLHLGFANGTELVFPLRMGEELEDVWSPMGSPKSPHRATVVWKGLDAASEVHNAWLQLYHAVFTNAHPSRPVTSVVIRSTQAITSPIVVGVTLE
jgi:serine/threonine protein kinase/WD40 repeat protein